LVTRNAIKGCTQLDAVQSARSDRDRLYNRTMPESRQPLTAFRLPPELLAELRETARATESTASEVLRAALRLYLDNQKVMTT
jgi:hypothetical protein